MSRAARVASRAARVRENSRWLGNAGLGPLAILVLVTVLLGVAPVATAWSLKSLIEGLDASSAQVALTVAALSAAVLTSTVAPHLSSHFEGVVRRAATQGFQDRLFAAINEAPLLDLLERPDFHNRLHLAREATDRAPTGLLAGGRGTAQGLITVGSLFIALGSIDLRLLGVAVAGAIPSLGAQLRLSARRNAMLWRVSPMERRRIFFSGIQADPVAAKEIRVFGLGDMLRHRMGHELRRINAEEQDLSRTELVTQAALAMLETLALIAAIVITVSSAAQGGLTGGDVAAVVVALTALQGAVAALARNFATTHEALGLLDHDRSVRELAQEQAGRAGHSAPGPLEDQIVFDDVWFRYTPDAPWVLRGVSCSFDARTTVGVVGLNGAGKSTMVKLLLGLLEPTRGRVLWDSRPLTDLDPVALRRRMSAVFQDHMAWDLSARDNITIGDLTCAPHDLDVRRAAEIAGIDQTIDALPAGYDTMLTRLMLDDEDDSSGVLLSGGQWQRLAVARALFRRDLDVLVLDERGCPVRRGTSRWRSGDQVAGASVAAASVVVVVGLGGVVDRLA